MEHRSIIYASKTGTISKAKARGAARFAKTAKQRRPRGAATNRPRSSGSHEAKHSSYFGFGFQPATAEPKGWSSSTDQMARSSKPSTKETRKYSGKRAVAAKPLKAPRKSSR
jgi:hypothetical protein